MYNLVSLVSLCPLIAKIPLTKNDSDIAFYGVNLNQSIILSKIGFGKGDTPWQTLQNLAIGNIIVSAAVRTRTLQISTNTANSYCRALCLDIMQPFHSSISWDESDNNSSAASSLLAYTQSGLAWLILLQPVY
jgi:hypothetical protein